MLTNCPKPNCVLQPDLFGEQLIGTVMVLQGFSDPRGRTYTRVSRPGKTGSRNEMWMRSWRAKRAQPDREWKGI